MAGLRTRASRRSWATCREASCGVSSVTARTWVTRAPTCSFFVICRLEDDVPVGRLDLFFIDRAHGSAAFGLAIGDPALWGKGYGTDAVNAIADFAFGQLRLERLWLDTNAHNARAQAVYTKCGFVREGVFRRAFYQDGRWSDDVRMAMIREEWLALDRPRSWDLAAARSRRAGLPSGRVASPQEAPRPFKARVDLSRW